MVISNVLLLIINIITDILNVESFRTWATLLSMTINIILLCVLTICLTAFPPDINVLIFSDIEADSHLASYFLWLLIEFMVIVSLILSCALFLMMRSCCRQKVTMEEVAESKQVPEVDTITAL